MLLGKGYGPVDTLNNITINLPDIANTFDPTNTVEVMNTNDDTDTTTVTGMNTNNVMRRSFDFETQIDDWESLLDDEEGEWAAHSTEFPLPSCKEVFRKSLGSFSRLLGRYCS